MNKLVYFSRVAFFLPDLNKYKPRENKRAGGLENSLFDTFIDMVVGYCMKQFILRVSALVLVGLKLPNRVRKPGGGIPYSFQNIPLCPGVWKNVLEKSVDKSVEKTMMYYLCY